MYNCGRDFYYSVMKLAKALEKYREIQRSIIKKYRKQIWNNFVGSVREYELINENDRIAVCISGGKDSALLACCMRELQLYSKIPFTLEYLVMDPGYNAENRRLIEKNLEILQIDAKIVESDIFDVTDKAGGAPCYLCARMRRGFLYSSAQELGCNKIALGHHFNDVIETTVMSMFYGSQLQAMLPKLHSQNFEGMELIRPLYKVKEKDIISWAEYNELKFLQCACKLTAKSADIELESKRKEIKALIAEIKKQNPQADDNIFRSLHNVNAAAIPGWRDKDGGEIHLFTENY